MQFTFKVMRLKLRVANGKSLYLLQLKTAHTEPSIPEDYLIETDGSTLNS